MRSVSCLPRIFESKINCFPYLFRIMQDNSLLEKSDSYKRMFVLEIDRHDPASTCFIQRHRLTDSQSGSRSVNVVGYLPGQLSKF